MIGIFDSGVGGLTLVRELLRLLPSQDFIYLADTARVPYGGRSPETIISYTQEAAEFLVAQGINLLVIACHTASAHALPSLQAMLRVPVIGVVEGGIEEILAVPGVRKVAILGTRSTIESKIYQNFFRAHHPAISVQALACPLFVPLIEEGFANHLATELIARHYLEQLPLRNLDAVLLACTHYPLLRSLLQRLAGPHVCLLEPARRTVERVRAFAKARTESSHPRFYVTDAPEKFQSQASLFLDRPIIAEKVSLKKTDFPAMIEEVIRGKYP